MQGVTDDALKRLVGVTLSVLEIGSPAEAIAIGPRLAELGYARYWQAEHYSPSQSCAPLVVAAALAPQLVSSDMRLGTAGILHGFRSPESIVAEASIVASLGGVGFDLGIAGAGSGAAELDIALLDGRPTPTRASLDAKTERLADLLQERLVGTTERTADLGPVPTAPIEGWVCGASVHSAALAARCGLRFAFHAGLCPEPAVGPDVVAAFRETWEASRRAPAPDVAVTIFTSLSMANSEAALGPDSAQWADQLARVADTYTTRDIVVCNVSGSVRDRLRGFASLSEIARDWL